MTVAAELVARVEAGDRRALARLITWIEDDDPRAHAALAGLYPRTGRAHIVGVTGAPGTGKSTLVSALAAEERKRGRTVGIISIDPTSPFTGGALLGDRIRMMEHIADRGVFMRSMASRGSVGGLSVSTSDAVRALDAFGCDVVFVETVGAGQAEIDIVRTAHSVIVIEAPGLGDEIQAFKAGILEIADVFVVNKADREGADKTANALKVMLDVGNTMKQRRGDGPARVAAPSAAEAGHHGAREGNFPAEAYAPTTDATEWRPPILKTVAAERRGVIEVVDALDAHWRHLRESGAITQRERERVEDEVRQLLGRTLTRRCVEGGGLERYAALVDAVTARALDPRGAVEALIGAWVAQRKEAG
ncbi:MAG TPA: methylmalonyl Co-A mutase-associated GTPase MeaB [Thermoflexales bacterium]|nr:methylmalonyl Co-A mutase-associated GTPase MeaB [Thermoflexales bacterium]